MDNKYIYGRYYYWRNERRVWRNRRSEDINCRSIVVVDDLVYYRIAFNSNKSISVRSGQRVLFFERKRIRHHYHDYVDDYSNCCYYSLCCFSLCSRFRYIIFFRHNVNVSRCCRIIEENSGPLRVRGTLLSIAPSSTEPLVAEFIIIRVRSIFILWPSNSRQCKSATESNHSHHQLILDEIDNVSFVMILDTLVLFILESFLSFFLFFNRNSMVCDEQKRMSHVVASQYEKTMETFHCVVSKWTRICRGRVVYNELQKGLSGCR